MADATGENYFEQLFELSSIDSVTTNVWVTASAII